MKQRKPTGEELAVRADAMRAIREAMAMLTLAKYAAGDDFLAVTDRIDAAAEHLALAHDTLQLGGLS